jgi:hypothetical protein
MSQLRKLEEEGRFNLLSIPVRFWEIDSQERPHVTSTSRGIAIHNQILVKCKGFIV